MKHVVHISSVHTPKDSRIFYRECTWLAQNGYKVTYMAPADPTVDPDRLTSAGVFFKGVKKPRTRLGRPLVWSRLWRQAVKQTPDIIHFHDPELLVLAPLFKLSAGRRLRLVYDVHEHFIAAIQDKYWIPERFRKAAAWAAARLESFLGRWVDAQVFVVHGQLPLYETWDTCKTVLHNYPDLARFTPLSGIARQGFSLVHIGSLYERRGIMTMLQALDILKNQGYFPTLILGGVFESQAFKQKVRKFIRAHDLGSQVQILGWIDYTDIRFFLDASQAAWLPHYPSVQHARESVCTKQLEAMLAGLPLVVSDIPILSRFVHEAGCGLCVPPLDVHAHAAAVRWLMDHPEQAAGMGKQGSRLVRSRYVWEQEAKHLGRLYQSV